MHARENGKREKREESICGAGSSSVAENGGVSGVSAPEKGAAALFRRLSQVADIIYRRGDKKRDV
jgi:hypothetical protein